MKRFILIFALFLSGCVTAPTPQIVVITVVVPPTREISTSKPVPTETISPTATITPTATATPNPCIRWDKVTLNMKGQTVCVRGIIRQIDLTSSGSHWDFTDDRTGFFAVSQYGGWHPITGKDMAVGDCVAITGVIQVLSNGRPYIFWGANSIFKSAVKGTGGYYEHPDLQVIEDNPSFCE